MEHITTWAQSTTNSVELVANDHGRITGVSVYSAHAEVTRAFKIDLKAGANQVKILGFPNVLNQESLRVEGRGSATINDVTISVDKPLEDRVDSKVVELKTDLEKTVNALRRTRTLLSSTEKYLASATAEHIDPSKLQEVSQNYKEVVEKLDDEVIDLKKKRSQLEASIKEERVKSDAEARRSIVVSISILANGDGEVGLTVLYAVLNAKWTCLYDIRVDTGSIERPVQVGYKAAITQDTGEDWTDVIIKLETASPAYGMTIPSLSRWTISSQEAPTTVIIPGSAPLASMVPWRRRSRERRRRRHYSPRPGRSSSSEGRARTYSPRRDYSPARRGHSQYSPTSPQYSPTSPATAFPEFDIAQSAAKSSITASFTVPGSMTIPSDGVSHKVTIAQIPAEADMEWLCIPKRDVRVYLKARIKNSSEYTLLEGPANVYVDGSFVAQSILPFVSPEDTFDCALGLDPSIRVIYPTLSKKQTTQTGFMVKPTRLQSFTQRVVIHNTKPLALAKLKVVDQIPISEEAGIVVKVLSPALTVPAPSAGTPKPSADAASVGSNSKKGLLFRNEDDGRGSASEKGNRASIALPNPVGVAQGIVAQWEGLEDVIRNGEDRDRDLNSITDGKFAWVCTNLAAQAKVNLVLEWEVSAPITTHIRGL